VELYLHSPNTPSWRGAQLKHRDNFIFLTFMMCGLVDRTSGNMMLRRIGGPKWNGDNYVIKNFIICPLHQTLVG
jgi:hypothetical protein